MLKMECPRCARWICSPLLTEMEHTSCPNCGSLVPVKEVYVIAGAYSIYRDVLLKNRFKYQKLLNEAERELNELMRAAKEAKPYEESARSISRFISDLKELLNGSRDKIRIPAGDTDVEFTVGDRSFKGSLVNISTTGVCIKAREGIEALDRGRSLILKFLGRKATELFKVKGEVVWAVKKNRQAGLRFVDLDKETQQHIKDYILEKSAVR